MAVDFVHVDTVLLRRVYALLAIEHGTRRAHPAGITTHPDGAWTTQAARNLLMDLGQRAASIKFLIRDRAGQFTSSFGAVLIAEGTRILASPPQAPRANAICERMIGTLRRELLDRTLIVNEQHLRQVLTEYLRHYNNARPHRALGQLTPAQADTSPPEPVNLAEHRIRRKRVRGRQPRVVPVLAGYHARLLDAARFAGNALICGGADQGRRNIASPLIAALDGGRGLPRLDTSRLRATWLADCAELLGLATFMHAAGISCSQRLGDLVAGLEPAGEAEAVRLLGAARRP
jgi:hypothetical protein